MRTIRYRDALREAIREEMTRDTSVFIMGEDIEDPFGGSYKVTKGLSTEFGKERVRNTPISELAIAGAALGAAITGMRPIAEIMYLDFTTLSIDQIVNQAAKIRYMSGGQVQVPLVIRTQEGSGNSSGAQHGQCLEAWYAHIPGLKVVMPATPADAKGLLKASIREDNPVVFIENKMLYNIKGEVSDKDEVLGIGKANIIREGQDVTIVSYSRMVHESIKAADSLLEEGISAEIIDLRTIAPLDIDTILRSVAKTHRLVIAHEAVVNGGIGGEVAARVIKEGFDELDAPIERVGSKASPLPFSPLLEKEIVCDFNDIVTAVQSIIPNAKEVTI
ncbi:alpha-ketoacid dehydrogenase subunit beta [Pseudalkalibacillus decolorationis]|uniref:alpha-ketoacid dehydrogenase subunit beta n=1 Tax=Pseudalkalibacillus decolorationis TaxID=163879 RepID=UPI0021482D57|nr:alpha-ketoacid dehydrogenase subunit beta [Pseudalkalibacillus decolorationis]